MFREDEIIILIGAGCSADAGIPTSTQMVKKVENLIKNNREWEKYIDIFNYVKSAILYVDGIKGSFGNNFDIERLVNVLGELEKKENSILYPFIGSWSPRLLEIAGYDFGIIREFKQKILKELTKWVRKSNYYRKFFEFAREYTYPLRIFSLNYDICIEKNKPSGIDLERGFDPETKTWDWRRFERSEVYEPAIYLYKLHGSIDWKRDKKEGNILKEVDRIPEEPDLIFGTDYKMQYVDPYLFYAYEFRKYSLEARVIIIIGYSFGDEHINSILKQALDNRNDRKLLIVSPRIDEDYIVSRLHCNDKKQVIVVNKRASEFLNELHIETLENWLN